MPPDPTAAKIEEQASDGVIVMGWLVEKIPQLTCVLPAANAMKQLRLAEAQIRQMPYRNLLAAVHGEFTEANQTQDQATIECANIAALSALLRNPLFGAEARTLLAEVRRCRRNLGVTVICQEGRFAFGVSTGINNMALTMIGKPQEQEKYPTPAAEASETWRTHVDPEVLEASGVPELHMTLFEPLNDRERLNHAVSMMVPETSQLEMRHAINVAIKAKARVDFLCDTAEQAEAMAAYAAPLLPGHRRIAYERAAAGQWGPIV
jgi:hypothetical protein